MFGVAFFIWLFGCFEFGSGVNIRDNGPVEYCNVDPSRWDFVPLSAADLQRVNKLEQIHIFVRHGTRITPHAIVSTFPNNNDLSFKCNVTTVETRYVGKNDWNLISVKKHYIPNEQQVEGNCQASQSLDKSILQHKKNAQMFKKFFIGNHSWALMTENELINLSKNIRKQGFTDEVRILAADYERTITSAIAFMSEFLNIHDPSVTMDLWTNDYKSDPYSVQDNYNCPKLKQWMQLLGEKSHRFQKVSNSKWAQKVAKQWKKETGLDYDYNDAMAGVLMYCAGLDLPITQELFYNALNLSYDLRKGIFHNYEISPYTSQVASAPSVWIIRQFIKRKIEALNKLKDNGNKKKKKESKTSKDNSKQSESLSSLTSSTTTPAAMDGARSLLGDNGDTDGESEWEKRHATTHNATYMSKENPPQIVFHSLHDFTILWMLEALDISNGREPMFAEMLTLEIYSTKNNDGNDNTIGNENDAINSYKNNIILDGSSISIPDTSNKYDGYLFRWTRKGKALRLFPGCQDVYFNGNDLCKLKILMDSLDYGVEIKEWEPQCRSITESYFDDLDTSFGGTYSSIVFAIPHLAPQFVIGFSLGAAFILIVLFFSKLCQQNKCKNVTGNCLYVWQWMRWRKYESIN